MRFTALSSVAYAASVAWLYKQKFFYLYTSNDDSTFVAEGSVHGYSDNEYHYHAYNAEFVQDVCVNAPTDSNNCYYASILRTLNEYYVADIMVYGLLALTAVLGIQNSIRKGESVYARISHLFVTVLTGLALFLVGMTALVGVYKIHKTSSNGVAANFTGEAFVIASLTALKAFIDIVNVFVPSSAFDFRRSDILTRGGVFSSVCALLVLFTYGATLIGPHTGLYRTTGYANWTVENDDGSVTAYSEGYSATITPSHVEMGFEEKWIAMADFDLNVENRSMVDQYTNNMTMLSLTLVGVVASIVLLNGLIAFNSSRRFISNSTAAWLKIFSTVVLISVVHTIFATGLRFLTNYIIPKFVNDATSQGHHIDSFYTRSTISVFILNIILAVTFLFDFVALVCETPYLDAAVQKIRDFNRPQVSTSRQEVLLADNSVATRV